MDKKIRLYVEINLGSLAETPERIITPRIMKRWITEFIMGIARWAGVRTVEVRDVDDKTY